MISGGRRRATELGVGFVALALADTGLAASDRPVARRLRYLTKPALMPALMAAFAASSAGAPVTRILPTRRATLAGQALSWAGDVALLPGGRRSFLAGLGSFFGAHVAYIAGFVAARDRSMPVTEAPGVRAAGLLWSTTAPAMALAAGRVDRKLRGPVAAYATVLSTMFATSTMLNRQVPAGPRRMVVTGTGLFLASDLMLGLREFVLPPESGRRLDAAVMATYAAGQGLIAAGVARL